MKNKEVEAKKILERMIYDEDFAYSYDVDHLNVIVNYIKQLEQQLSAKDKALDKACEKLAYINSIRFTCEEDRCNRNICDACCNNECNDSSAWKEWCEHRVEKASGIKGIELNSAKEHIKEILEDASNEEHEI